MTPLAPKNIIANDVVAETNETTRFSFLCTASCTLALNILMPRLLLMVTNFLSDLFNCAVVSSRPLCSAGSGGKLKAGKQGNLLRGIDNKSVRRRVRDHP